MDYSPLNKFIKSVENKIADVELETCNDMCNLIVNVEKCRITGKINILHNPIKIIEVETNKNIKYYVGIDKIKKIYYNRKPDYDIGYKLIVAMNHYEEPYNVIIAQVINIYDKYTHFEYELFDLKTETKMITTFNTKIIAIYEKHNYDEHINRLSES